MDSSKTASDGVLLPERRRVGLLYDERMCKHFDATDHPENPNRILAIWNKLESFGIHQRCVILNAKEADDKHIALVHTRSHVDFIKNISYQKFGSKWDRIAARFNSIYFNEGSSEAAYLAAGSVVEVAEKVAKGELDSAFAIVRPPGHHAEANEPMGFCLYNNVAIATSFLLNERTELGIKKILVVDWDVHHGNGTQKMFYKDSRVLFFSVHRHEFGCFYPGGDDGSYVMIGEGPGAGYNINVPWENRSCGDADYLAVWDHILIPVAKAFDPDMVIISAGFDAAVNDPLGGCCVSPYGYSIMLSKLMEFAEGKIVMALEGGYNLKSLANSALACVQVLLGDKPIVRSLQADPFESTWRVLEAVREALSAFWPIFAKRLPEELTSKRTSLILIPCSDSEDEYDNGPNTTSEDYEAAIEHVIGPLQNLEVDDGHGTELTNGPNTTSEDYEVAIEHVIEPLQNLKVENGHDQAIAFSSSWRSELSKIDIWYATYGSNMRESRFLCYIEGGQVEGMQKQCVGSVDKSPPKESCWRTFPHRLFFARDYTATWGPGGVAFLHPESNSEDKAYLRLYRITLEQFNDVLVQENILSSRTGPLFGLKDLQSIEDKKCISIEAIKRGWYHNVLYLGKEDNLPVITMTCTLYSVDNFKSGKFPMCAPGRGYANTLIMGLVEGNRLSNEEAVAYIEEASTKKL
ncbi:histone deacetylase 5-like isoform X1 [Coffea arabica]|uniref:histone deacetylase n=1 Tax=Coffea arabica TaxID=13443 RepID=A0A6P6SR56_COFAR|nr:histone deacetylase 5-like isoform X1 [Coffea arabica]